MKKVLLSRLVVITIFCFVSIAIKSETTACKLIFPSTAKAGASAPVKLLKEETENNFYRPYVFYIKI